MTAPGVGAAGAPESADLSGVDSRRLASGAAIALVIISLVLPLVLSSYWVDTVTKWIPLAVAALGLNLLTGYNGQISVGHGAFYGVGAYTTALLITNAHWPFVPALIVAAVLCFVTGVIVGLPALRIKGLYLALVTLAVATLFPQIVEQFSSFTKGSTGLRLVTETVNRRGATVEKDITFEAPSWMHLSERQWTYYLLIAVALLCFVIARNLVTSRVGRAMVAIRDNEIAAEVNGINVARIKVLTFGVSAAMAGVGGGLLAMATKSVGPASFGVAASLYFLVAVVIGGPASIVGPALGAVFYGAFNDVVGPELPDSFRGALPLVLGALLIGLMFVAPGGIVGWLRGMVAKRQGAAVAPAPLGSTST